MTTFLPGQVTMLPGEPRAFALTDGDIGRDLDRRASNVQIGMRFRVRVRSGTLLSTIRKNPGVAATGQYVDILAGGRKANYVLIEELGSPPHRISARNRKSLRFVWHGQVVFRQSVMHPGTTGTHFMTRSLPLAAS